MHGADAEPREVTPAAQPDGPFAGSKVKPTPTEAQIGWLIWRRAGRERAISIDDIIAAIGGDLDERKVKDAVQQLRVTHRAPIGSRRGGSGCKGYYRIVDAEDLEATVRPYEAQVLSMWRVLRALMPARRLRELHGQLTLGTEAQ